MTISELQALLPSNITLKTDGNDIDSIQYHFWWTNVHVGTIDTDSNGDITAVNIEKQYQSQIENNAEVNKVLKENNLNINYV